MPDWKPEIRQRLAGVKLEPAREAAIVEELAQYLDDHYAELLAGGESEAEAYRQTLAELSGSELLAHELRRAGRQVTPELIVLGTNRRTNMIADLWQDLRFGVRMLMKNPGGALIAVMALALGIGVNTTILSVVNGSVLRPLPVEKPDELVKLFRENKKDGEVWGAIAYANYADLRDQNKTLSGLLASKNTSVGISDGVGHNSGDGARAEVVFGELVSGNYFDVLGVKPILGRGFLPEEDQTPGSHPVAILNYSCWQGRFGADPSIVGKTISLNNHTFNVVGVAPKGFIGTEVAYAPAFWAPIMMAKEIEPGSRWLESRDSDNLFMIGRLKPGVTVGQTKAALGS